MENYTKQLYTTIQNNNGQIYKTTIQTIQNKTIKQHIQKHNGTYIQQNYRQLYKTLQKYTKHYTNIIQTTIQNYTKHNTNIYTQL